MPQALIALIAVVLVVGTVAAIKIVNARQRREWNNLAQKAQTSWQNASKVRELMTLYLDVLLVHGPDSHEAKAFRFGVDNAELWKGNDALEIFHEMTDICDVAVRRHGMWRFGHRK